MVPAKKKLLGIFQTLSTLAVFSALWFAPLYAGAGELTEVPDGPKLEFSLPDIVGQQRSLDDFAGKVLVVNFWASWCRPCIVEMPSIQRLAQAMRDSPFAVIAINVGEAKRRVQATVTRLDVDFPVLLDKDSTVFEDWGANVLPTTYVLDRSGRARYVGRGPLEWDRADIIELLGRLAEPQPDRN
jgi:thiol-disulfide isomerase/thioredoxin